MRYAVWAAWALFALAIIFATIGAISILAFPTAPVGLFFLANLWLPVALRTLPAILTLSYPVAAFGALLGLALAVWYRFFPNPSTATDPDVMRGSDSSLVSEPVDSPATELSKEFAQKYGIRVSEKSPKKDMNDISNMLDARELIQKSWRIYSPYHRVKLARIEKRLDEANIHKTREPDYFSPR